MDWNILLSTEKLASEETEPVQFKAYPISPFEKDYRKIINSAAFRRLQDKTQVFPLDKSDFVRTRLTHSLEVSAIAKQLGVMAVNNLVKRKKKAYDPEETENIAAILQCAGLLHDLGNPPFGHFGETIIGDWFEENLCHLEYCGKPLQGYLDLGMRKDLENFEGNAQALRILLKSRYNAEVNISVAIISTLVKYPVDSLSFSAEHPDHKKHKVGVYLAEKETFESIACMVGTRDGSGQINRHPLTYLLEAADDIAYRTSDLQDAYKKKLFTLDAFIEFCQQECAAEKANGNSSEIFTNKIIKDLILRRGKKPSPEADDRVFEEWLNSTRNWLMHSAAYGFSTNYNVIMKGEYKNNLFTGTNHSFTIELFQRVMKTFVFNSSGILKLELSAQSILSFLLKGFVHAVIYYDCDDKITGNKPTKADKKYLELLSVNYKEDYKKAKTGNEKYDLYLRLLMVTDYISGMTDTYARTLYRELSGIE